MIKYFGLAKTPLQIGIFNIDSDNFESPSINLTMGNQRLDIRWWDNELGSISLGDFNINKIERDNNKNSDADILNFPNLGLIKEFMITSESLANYTRI
jgi:hypothetical protein